MRTIFTAVAFVVASFISAQSALAQSPTVQQHKAQRCSSTKPNGAADCRARHHALFGAQWQLFRFCRS